MQANGNKIIGSKTNNPMQVKGMSFFWSNWSTHMYSSTNVDRMVDEFKCEMIRCPFGVDDNGNPYSPSDEAKYREVIEEAIERDIYVIIDWHSHGAHNNVNAAKDFLDSSCFGKYDNVIFEVFNEPTNIAWTTVKYYAEQVIQDRKTYSAILYSSEPRRGHMNIDIAADNPINDKNVAYVIHFYAGTHSQYLRDKANYGLNKNITVFVSEWGSVNADGNGAINYNSTQEWLDWMDQNKLSWCNWAINDKDETSSIFYSNGSLREAGVYLKSILNDSAKYAEWRDPSHGEESSSMDDSSNNVITQEVIISEGGSASLTWGTDYQIDFSLNGYESAKIVIDANASNLQIAVAPGWTVLVNTTEVYGNYTYDFSPYQIAPFSGNHQLVVQGQGSVNSVKIIGTRNSGRYLTVHRNRRIIINTGRFVTA